MFFNEQRPAGSRDTKMTTSDRQPLWAHSHLYRKSFPTAPFLTDKRTGAQREVLPESHTRGRCGAGV